MSVLYTIVVVVGGLCMATGALAAADPGFRQAVNHAWPNLRNEIRWRRRPLVYVCERDFMLSLVRARDYRRWSRNFWRVNEKVFTIIASSLGQVISVAPVFLFSGYETKHPILTGDWYDLGRLAMHCRVECANFHVAARYDEYPTNALAPQERVYNLREACQMIWGKRRAKKLFPDLFPKQ